MDEFFEKTTRSLAGPMSRRNFVALASKLALALGLGAFARFPLVVPSVSASHITCSNCNFQGGPCPCSDPCGGSTNCTGQGFPCTNSPTNPCPTNCHMTYAWSCPDQGNCYSCCCPGDCCCWCKNNVEGPAASPAAA